MATSDTYVALLRGVNVGGNNKLPMAQLRGALTHAGMQRVDTYIQSGNVVLGSPLGSPAAVAAEVHRCIQVTFGFDIAVVVRGAEDFLALRARGSHWPNLEPAKALVLFYPDVVDDEALNAIDASAFLPETWHAEGRELHLYLPDGIATSKLVVAIGRKLAGGTGRNWNTITKLAAMVEATE